MVLKKRILHLLAKNLLCLQCKGGCQSPEILSLINLSRSISSMRICKRCCQSPVLKLSESFTSMKIIPFGTSPRYYPIVVTVTSVKTGLLRITEVATAEHDMHLMVAKIMSMAIVMMILPDDNIEPLLLFEIKLNKSLFCTDLNLNVHPFFSAFLGSGLLLTFSTVRCFVPHPTHRYPSNPIHPSHLI